MDYTLAATGFTLALFFGMLLLLEIGRRIGVYRIAKDPERARAGVGAIEGAIFGLFGLLIAFTFSGAASRFDSRRQLIVAETNDIGTAYLRLDLLPADRQPALRENFRRYVDARRESYRKLPDIAAAKEENIKALKLQEEIWRLAVAASRTEGASPAAPMLLLPALNDMIDITTTRTMITQLHPARIVFAMLFGLALASALLAGYAMAGANSRSWLHMVAFAFVISFAVYVILDMEYPRLGLIQVDTFDRALTELRESMK